MAAANDVKKDHPYLLVPDYLISDAKKTMEFRLKNIKDLESNPVVHEYHSETTQDTTDEITSDGDNEEQTISQSVANKEKKYAKVQNRLESILNLRRWVRQWLFTS